MEAFETTLTGSDGQISGLVNSIKFPGSKQAHEFVSIDDTLHLSIALDSDGKWIRIAGTTPYFPGWIDELAEKIISETNHAKTIPAAAGKKAPAVKAKPTANKITPVKAEEAVSVKTVKGTPKKDTVTIAKSKPTVKKAAIKAEPAKKTKPAIATSKKVKVASAATKK